LESATIGNGTYPNHASAGKGGPAGAAKEIFEVETGVTTLSYITSIMVLSIAGMVHTFREQWRFPGGDGYPLQAELREYFRHNELTIPFGTGTEHGS
jgi:hypothetical protein